MKSLSEFPSELLSLILSFSSSSVLLVSLWKCGDVVLNKKLVNGVEHVDLKDPSLVSTSRFPKLILALKNLRSLCLCRYKFPLSSSAKQLWSDIQAMSRNKLEKLDLESYEIPQLLMLQSSLLRSSSASNSDAAKLHTFQIFSNLTTLVLSGSPSDSIIAECQLHLLPPSLTYLQMRSFMLNIRSGPVFSKLPRSLLIWATSLEFIDSEEPQHPEDALSSEQQAFYAHNKQIFDSTASIKPIFANIWSNAPPLLHTVTEWWITCDLSIDSFDFLPRTLVECDIIFQDQVWTPSLFRSLPPLLNHFTISNMDFNSFSGIAETWTSLLPRYMTSWDFALAETTLPLSTAALALAPPTLTRLNLSQDDQYHLDWKGLSTAIEKASASSSEFWPPSLVYWEFTKHTFLEAYTHILPKTLTTLSIHWNGSHFDALSSHLPNLTSLGASFSLSITTFYAYKLPPKLSYLSMRSSHSSAKIVFEPPPTEIAASSPTAASTSMDPPTTTESSSRIISHSSVFSASLDHLEIISARSTAMPISQHTPIILPSNGLRVLRVDGWDARWLPHAPSTLQHFRVTLFSSCLLIPAQELFTLLTALPRGLKTLNLFVASIEAPATPKEGIHAPTATPPLISSLFFSYFPHLVDIHLTPVAILPCSSLVHAPPSLRRVSLCLENFLPEFTTFINPRWTYMSISLADSSNINLLLDHWPPQAEAWRLTAEQRAIVTERVQQAMSYQKND